MTTTVTRTRLIAVANALPTSHRVGCKAWLHRVWLAGYTHLDYRAFQTALWSLANAGMVELGRCDMVEGFNPQDVRRSNMVVNGCTYNFLVLD